MNDIQELKEKGLTVPEIVRYAHNKKVDPKALYSILRFLFREENNEYLKNQIVSIYKIELENIDLNNPFVDDFMKDV